MVVDNSGLKEKTFSLPTQRCFHHSFSPPFFTALFSAYAEVFPALWGCLRSSICFSLPTQRCFPPIQTKDTPTEAFLCLRRGVSLIVLLHASAVIFSLPTQWCFWVDRFDLRFTVLFSAYAEVFPTLRFFSTAVPAFLCLRRGVSTLHIVNHYTNSFSLPTQRCFH